MFFFFVVFFVVTFYACKNVNMPQQQQTTGTFCNMSLCNNNILINFIYIALLHTNWDSKCSTQRDCKVVVKL